jgi:hypothetical protein
MLHSVTPLLAPALPKPGCPHQQSRNSLVSSAMNFTPLLPVGAVFATPAQRCNSSAAQRCNGAVFAAPAQRAWLRDAEAHPERLRQYLRRVYEQPIEMLQVDLSQILFFWSAVPSLGHNFQVWWACFNCDYPTGAFWAPLSDAMLDPCTEPEPMPFPGFFVTRSPPIQKDVRMTGVPDNTWVEIIRIARRDDKGKEPGQCLVGQVWFWVAPGSGEQRAMNVRSERESERERYFLIDDRVALEPLSCEQACGGTQGAASVCLAPRTLVTSPPAARCDATDSTRCSFRTPSRR